MIAGTAILEASQRDAARIDAASSTDIPPKIVIRDLRFFYKEFEALRGINLALRDKSVTAFIGPSGCGKSTLLRVINRIYDLYPGQRATGEVLLDGRNILDPKQDLNLLRAKVGMVVQKPTPFPMSIADYTAFMYLGELIEVDETETIFTKPRMGRTEDYITGRFG